DGVWLGLTSTVLGMAQVLHATLNHASFNLGIPVESHQRAVGITRLKLVKRQMYGRGKLDLLQARLIGAA
ncbi:hypothetical protein ABGN05_27235, partial [Aquibium sp. LZ166]